MKLLAAIFLGSLALLLFVAAIVKATTEVAAVDCFAGAVMAWLFLMLVFSFAMIPFSDHNW